MILEKQLRSVFVCICPWENIAGLCFMLFYTWDGEWTKSWSFFSILSFMLVCRQNIYVPKKKAESHSDRFLIFFVGHPYIILTYLK